MLKKQLKKIANKEVLYIVISVVAISLLASSIFAYYTYGQSEEEVSEVEEEELSKEEISAKVDELLDSAKRTYYDGQYDKSISYYQQALKLEQDNLEVAINLATIYEERGRYDLAIDIYEQSLENTFEPEIKFDLAVAYYKRGDFEAAETALLELSEEDDVKDEYLTRQTKYYLSLIATKNEDYQQSREYIDQALQIGSFALGYRQAGDIEYETGNYQQATDYYRNALDTDGSLVGVKKKLGFSYLELEDYEEAVDYLLDAQDENDGITKVNQTLDELEEEYPDYFEEEERVLPEDMEQQIPANVDFRDISPLEEAGQKIRIGIKNDKEEIYFRVGSSFKVVDKINRDILGRGLKGELSKVSYVDGRHVLEIGDHSIDFSRTIEVVPDNYAPVLLHNVIYGKGYYWGGIQDRQYRGQMEFMPGESGLTAVNLVGLEEYLLSVVPTEMSASWPLEALKTQSVAARSYTLANLNRFQSRGYDLCDTVMSAAYNGITREHPRSTEAVLETSGEIMTYNDSPVNAVYSANSGGHTESGIDVWGHDTPYLQAVSTAEQVEEGSSLFPLEPKELRDWLQDVPDSYSNQPSRSRASNYRWQRKIGIDYLENRTGVSNIEEVIPTSRSEAGSVSSMLVVGEDESKEFRNNLRSRFGGLRSNRFWVSPIYEAGELVAYNFYGSGWGHSVGMDQVAVSGMAEDSYKYTEILKHFYTDIELEKAED